MIDPDKPLRPLQGLGRAINGPRWEEIHAARQQAIADTALEEARQARHNRILQACATVFVLGCLLATLAILTAGAVWAWGAAL